MKLEFFQFKKVTSTNDVAIKLIKKKKKEKGFIIANEQTRGRGARGKKWISKEGNLFGSIFFKLKNNYPPFNEFSIINPVIISKVIKDFCKEETVSIKWPNDILVNKKKICGILQEKVEKFEKKYLVVGIGINLVKSPNILNYPTNNLLQITNKKINKKKFEKDLKISFEKFLSKYYKTN